MNDEEYSYAGEVDEDLVCGICHKVLRDPAKSSCRHVFCRGCLEGAQASKADPLCPACHSSIDKIKTAYKEQNRVLELPVHCPNRHLGCMWVRAREKLERHLARMCKKQKRQCKHGCGFEAAGKELKEHEPACPSRGDEDSRESARASRVSDDGNKKIDDKDGSEADKEEGLVAVVGELILEADTRRVLLEELSSLESLVERKNGLVREELKMKERLFREAVATSLELKESVDRLLKEAQEKDARIHTLEEENDEMRKLLEKNIHNKHGEKDKEKEAMQLAVEDLTAKLRSSERKSRRELSKERSDAEEEISRLRDGLREQRKSRKKWEQKHRSESEAELGVLMAEMKELKKSMGTGLLRNQKLLEQIQQLQTKEKQQRRVIERLKEKGKRDLKEIKNSAPALGRQTKQERSKDSKARLKSKSSDHLGKRLSGGDGGKAKKKEGPFAKPPLKRERKGSIAELLAKEGMQTGETLMMFVMLNAKLKYDKSLRDMLPLQADGAFFEGCRTGVLLGKIVSRFLPGSLDESALILKQGEWGSNRNLAQVLAATREVSSRPPDKALLIAGDRSAILALCHDVVYGSLSAKVRASCRAVARGSKEGKDEEEEWSMDKLLARWVSHLLGGRPLVDHLKDHSLEAFFVAVHYCVNSPTSKEWTRERFVELGAREGRQVVLDMLEGTLLEGLLGQDDLRHPDRCKGLVFFFIILYSQRTRTKIQRSSSISVSSTPKYIP